MFHCQLAQGSPTGIISGFTNVKELYEKIAQCYDMLPSDVSFMKYSTSVYSENCFLPDIVLYSKHTQSGHDTFIGWSDWS